MLIVGIASLLMSCLLGQNVNAITYNVGISGQTDYATLDDLRTGGITWNDGDVIILHNNDNSLTDAFDFNGKNITISGNATISPASYSYVQFASSSNPMLLTIANGSSIVFDGFNRNDGYSGAIYNGGNVTISGTGKFTNNVANYSNGTGGAIYSVGDVTIIASDGDIVFKGNEASVPNAIYMYNDSNNKILSLAAINGNKVEFYDTIESYYYSPNLTIKINEQNNQTGTVLFDMSYNGGYRTSAIYGSTTVSHGTLALKGGAVYGSSNNTGSFELKEDATLLVTGIGSAINSIGSVTLDGTLAFDLTGLTTSNTVLTFNGTTSGTIKNIEVDIHAFNGTGDFNLVTTTSGTFTFNDTNLTTHGKSIVGTRAEGNISLVGNGTNTLKLTSNITKQTVTWDTTKTNGTWDATTENWKDGSNADIKFLHGDDVNFEDLSNCNHKITIQDEGVTIGDPMTFGINNGTMTFRGVGTWTFTGGEIEGGIIRVGDNYYNNVDTDTKIYFDTRQMNQIIEVGRFATTTIAATQGETLTFKGLGNTRGAIYADNNSNLKIGEEGSSVIFDANFGGAIHGYFSSVTISGTSTFSNNLGGAILCKGNLTISGTSIFSNNVASVNGGAIFCSADLNITASDGNIVFAGNEANSHPNAISLENYYNNGIISLAATDGNKIEFYEPIDSNSYHTNLIIKINGEVGQTGTVLFDMSNNNDNNGDDKISKIYGSMIVYNGTLALRGEAVYGADDNAGSFELKEDAALLVTGKDNTINASGDVTLDGTLAFDLTGISSNSSDVALTLNGTIAATSPTIDIRETVIEGKYILINSTNDVLSSLTLPTTFTYHGENVENTRAKAINLDITDNKKLVLNVDAQNHSVTWTGSVDGTWNITENNWNGTNGVNTITQFLHNDDVIFSTTIQPIQKNISVNSSGVNVKTMTVNENGYKFSGGKIAGDSLALNSTSTNETIFQNEIDFTNGITVAQNNTLTFDYATDKTDSNKFSGLGTLKKSGSGTLTLTRDNSGATGMTFTQTDGIVNLQNIWGGSYMQSNSATLILSDNAKIGDDANLSGVVDITNGKLDVGGNLVLASGSVLKMTIAENKIVADSVTIDNDAKIELSQIPTGRTEKVIVAKTTPLNPSQLNSYFTLNSNKLLMSIQPFYSNDYKEMGFENSPQTAEQYTIKNNFRKNQVQIAALLDGYAPIQSQLNSLDTREQLEGLVKSLLAPELAAEAIALPLNNPYFRIFHHVNNLPINNNLRNVNSQSTNSGATFRGQSACSPIECNVERNKYELWFEGYYQGGETRGDANALSYKTSRGGMMVGADQYFDDGLLLGLIFGYGNPQVYNSVGKIEADDYTFGVYSRIKIFGIYTNTFVGYGNQNYQLRQNITNPNQHTNYNGDSFYASLELFQPINLRNDLSISPLFAIDFQKAWSDGFKTNAYIPLTVNKGDIDQTILRIGVNSNYKNLRTRLQYGYQIAGDFYGISRTSITGNNGNRILSGVNLGRHSLNAGLGGDFRIGNRTNLFADYDLDLGKLSTNHTGQFGFVRYF